MPHIQQLSPHVADLIAAGEVVERPASVVKELLENAIDAGAQSVTVEMKNGGMTYLRVSDDGCGIAPSELPTAFLRHATSKLRTAEDLAAIGTLGFRGEALAAISSVSRLDIFSRERGALSGAKLHLEGGVPGTVEDAGCPEGTSIIVRDLFYNTPARLKFMKRDSAEATAIAGLVGHLALSHPEVSFKLIKDGTQTLLTPGDGALRSAIYASLGREFTLSLLEVKGADGDMGVTGFVTSPIASRGTRGMQTFFVNGRLVKSQLLTAALEEAYSNRMMKGKFPGCVLLVELPRDMVDVNVHPAKTIVKFVGEKRVFDLVYHAVMAALDKREEAERPQPKPASQVQNPRGDFFANMTSQQYRESRKTAEKPAYTPAGARPVSAPQSAPVKPAPAPQWQTRVPAIDTQSGGKAALSDYVRHETPASAPVLSAQQSQPVEKSVHSVENHDDEVVTLPMPPGTGVQAATVPTASAATSPSSVPSGRAVTPASSTICPGCTQSGVMSPGAPAAASRMSASRQCAARPGVFRWQSVTVASARVSSSAAGRPMTRLRPTTVTRRPAGSKPHARSRCRHASAVQGAKPAAPVSSAPSDAVVMPSTSLRGSSASSRCCARSAFGSGRSSSTPCTVSSALRVRSVPVRASAVQSAGRSTGRTVTPHPSAERAMLRR